jgi:hypothetical protein
MCWGTGTSTEWSTNVSSASTRLRVNASVDLWGKK